MLPTIRGTTRRWCRRSLRIKPTASTTGPLGTSSNRIQFADNANTAQQNVVIGPTNQPSSVFLGGLTFVNVAHKAPVTTPSTSSIAVRPCRRNNLLPS